MFHIKPPVILVEYAGILNGITIINLVVIFYFRLLGFVGVKE